MHPGVAAIEAGVAQTHSHLGMELWDVGKHAESRTHFRRAQESFRRALALAPEDVWIMNSACWFLSFFQDPAYRDPATALALAHRLVSLTSEREQNRLHLSGGMRPFFILGLAEYRVGDYSAARKALERSMELREGGDAYEWFVMAMVLARQGEVDRARNLHGEATRWMRRFRYSDFELHALDSEAAVLLGVPVPSTPTTKQVEKPKDRLKSRPPALTPRPPVNQ
jgi:Tfp pilus assembly protein PilF